MTQINILICIYQIKSNTFVFKFSVLMANSSFIACFHTFKNLNQMYSNHIMSHGKFFLENSYWAILFHLLSIKFTSYFSRSFLIVSLSYLHSSTLWVKYLFTYLIIDSLQLSSISGGAHQRSS